MIDEILNKFNLKYSDLNTQERETLNNWLKALSKKELTLIKVREYLATMRTSVEKELTDIGHDSKQDIFLKARLRNYMLLEDFLNTPEKAKEAMERALAGLGGKH